MNLKQKLATLAAVPATALVASPVFAADGWDYSSILSGVDFGTIAVGVLAVAAALAGVYAGIKGARIVIGFLRG